MIRTSTLAAWLLFLTAQAFGQLVPPPCGQQGVPNDVPCYDTKSAKVIHTDSSSTVPHEDFSPWAKAALSGMYQAESPTELPVLKPPIDVNAALFAPLVIPAPVVNRTTTAKIEQTLHVRQSDDSVLEEQRQQNYRTGYAIGQGLGAAIYAVRLRHAINKACFDRGARGWTLPNGQVIDCRDWMASHRRKTRR